MGWTDRYALVFGTTVALLLLAPFVQDALTGLGHQADPVRAGAGLALLGFLYAGYLASARAFGPVALPAADAAWLLLSPLSRRRVLARPALVLLGVAVAGGLALGVSLLAVLGAPPGRTALLVAAALVLGVSATVGGTAVAVLAQAADPWDGWLRLGILAVVVAAVLAALLSGPAGRLAQAVPASLGAALVAACAVAAALAVRLAWARLGRIHARDLLAASTRLDRVATATTMLDPGTLTWIAEDAHWRGRALRSRRWPGLPAPLALAWHDWRRLGRRPGRLAVLLASAALPALAVRAAGGVAPVAVALVAAGALAATASCTVGARRDADDPALARLSGVAPRAALAARALLPALVGGLWLALALAGLAAADGLPGGPWWPLALPAAPALAAGALRMARRPPVDHTMPVVTTPAGPLPTGPTLWALTGADLALLGCLPTLQALLAPSTSLGPTLVAQAGTGTAVLVLYLWRARTR
ncbi:hypothetical protein DPM19_05490 [Actinomadura craniellae]|uniref:Uncharacterized protein n=2 Tax=Actinomadura craniellae TaxID=2231787 RepID=A0A365HC54_9ACTN|nr:hypothetical protein DPM19_05490 [Actinomadura craniellae]